MTSNAVPVLLKMANSSISQSSPKEIPHPLSSHSHPTAPAPGIPSVSVVCLFDTFSRKWLHAVRSLLPGISGSTRHAQGGQPCTKRISRRMLSDSSSPVPPAEGIPFGGWQRTSHVSWGSAKDRPCEKLHDFCLCSHLFLVVCIRSAVERLACDLVLPTLAR